MELSFVVPDTQTHRYVLKLAGLSKGTGPGTTPVDLAWMDDALAVAVRVFNAHHVHFTDAYFAYHAREITWHPKYTAGKTTVVHIAGDLHDDMPLLMDTSAVAQLVALVSLEASSMADVVDICLVVERLRDDTPAPPADGIGDVTFVSETGVGVQSVANRY